MADYKINHFWWAWAVAAGLVTGNAQAAQFYFGEDSSIELVTNTQLSAGASWLIDDPSPNIYHVSNEFEGVPGNEVGSATDDGSLNFSGGKTFSKIIKGFTELGLSKDDYGLFTRVKYWYDKELNDERRPHGNSVNGYAQGEPLSDDGFSDYAQFSGIELLDAYAYSSFYLGDTPVDVRLGRQVVNWGESVFIQGGLNAINPIDVSALRRPGAELEEAYMPAGMLFVQAGLTNNLSIEAFYQYEWEKVELDGCGTLFSTADFVADGCNWVTVGEYPKAVRGDQSGDFVSLQTGLGARRAADVEPEDEGQFGVALRYYVEPIDTEFGFYAMNIHSRTPNLSAIRSGWVDYGVPPAIPFATVDAINNAFPQLQALVDAGGPSSLSPEQQQQYSLGQLFQSLGVETRAETEALNPRYRVEYVEDLQIYGVSFATNIGGFAVSGEASFKPDTPINLNGSHIVAAALQEDTSGNIYPFFNRFGEPGEAVQGWDYVDQTQLQVNALKFFDRVLGASRLTIIGEVGITFLDGIDELNDQGFYHGRDPLYGLSLETTNIPGVSIDQGAGFSGFVTETSWGYRARAVLDYPNVLAGISLKPTFAWSHDVNGNSGSQFQEGRKSYGVSLEASYLQKYSAMVSYTGYSGGQFSALSEKDFVSLSLSVAL